MTPPCRYTAVWHHLIAAVIQKVWFVNKTRIHSPTFQLCEQSLYPVHGVDSNWTLAHIFPIVFGFPSINDVPRELQDEPWWCHTLSLFLKKQFEMFRACFFFDGTIITARIHAYIFHQFMTTIVVQLPWKVVVRVSCKRLVEDETAHRSENDRDSRLRCHVLSTVFRSRPISRGHGV